MEQFNLEKWLQDKSRKVVTREGKPVRIVCWDSPNKGFPIVGFIDNNPTVFIWDKYGYALSGHRESNRDLFFADEENELTEFENKLVEIIKGYCSINENGEYTQSCLKDDSKELLDLARKELEKGNPYNGSQKQELSEKDKNMLLGIINDAEQGGLLDEEQINWLKSLKDNARPQPKYQWTDEDEKNLKDLLAYGETKLGLRRWIAGLPEKLGSRSEYHWKPSEEQMQALFESKLASIKNREYFLRTLYEDLKKL